MVILVGYREIGSTPSLARFFPKKGFSLFEISQKILWGYFFPLEIIYLSLWTNKLTGKIVMCSVTRISFEAGKGFPEII